MPTEGPDRTPSPSVLDQIIVDAENAAGNIHSTVNTRAKTNLAFNLEDKNKAPSIGSSRIMGEDVALPPRAHTPENISILDADEALPPRDHTPENSPKSPAETLNTPYYSPPVV